MSIPEETASLGPTSKAQSPKEQLVEKAIAYVSEHGLSDVSLRELAAGMGTSHRMLLYHFGSKDGLLVEVSKQVERRQQEVLEELLESSKGDRLDLARTFWRQLRSPELAPMERLFFELYGQGLQGRPYATGLLSGIVEDWLEKAVAPLVASGMSVPEARAEARLSVAVVRGLLLDVLATGADVEVDAAYELYLSRFPAPVG